MRILPTLWRKLAPDVIVQRRLHDTLFALSLRDHLLWIVKGDAADGESVPLPTSGHVWDLGCNIGLYSVQAARRGCTVSAFDISLTNVLCLNQTARMNGLDIRAYHSPITCTPANWSGATTGHTEESLTRHGSLLSMTYLEAEQRCGTPNFIKFDIQGGETEFLQDEAFHQWINDRQITVYLETHNDAANYVWPEFKSIGPIHFLREPIS